SRSVSSRARRTGRCSTAGAALSTRGCRRCVVPTRGCSLSGSFRSTVRGRAWPGSGLRSALASPPGGCPLELPGAFRRPPPAVLDPARARLADSGIPFVLHVGGGKLLSKAFHQNGRPRPTDWLGGGENLRSKDFPVLHHSPERFIACLVLDGVFQRHPGLHG